MNKVNENILRAYNWSDKLNLYMAYGRFSEKKADAWQHCEELCKEKHGWGLKVIGANSSFFSAGFMFEDEGVRKLMYITHMGERDRGAFMKIGDKIRIIYMEGEPQYTGKEGVVKSIDGIGQVHGTWGGCAVVPEVDIVEVIG